MRTLLEVMAIITAMDDELFETLNESSIDALFRVRGAKVRYENALKKAGLTDEEWWMWENA